MVEGLRVAFSVHVEHQNIRICLSTYIFLKYLVDSLAKGLDCVGVLGLPKDFVCDLDTVSGTLFTWYERSKIRMHRSV